MASRSSPEIDDELFDEVYGKAYTGPQTSVPDNVIGKSSTKRSNDQSDDNEEGKDPNAVPTDFTSREARVWEAKAKATERNWKKRKEEELICKICGESGHFTQGCPSTLGANRKSADFFERVPARDARVRALFSEKVIHQIERDVGCKLRMDEKFLFVSGKDRLILAKGVDAVHKIIQAGDKDKGKDSSCSLGNRSRSPDSNSLRNRSRSPTFSSLKNKPRSPNELPADSQIRHSETERSYSSQRNASNFRKRNIRQEKIFEDHSREDPKKMSKGFSQAYNNGGAKHGPMRSKSPQKSIYTTNSFGPYGGQERKTMPYISGSRDVEKRGSDVHSGQKFDFSHAPGTLEELEMEFKREAMEFGRVRDKEEDEENYRHRECIRELRENYVKKLATLREAHTKQWENFLRLESQIKQQPHHKSYNQPGYFGYDQSSGNPDYAGISGQTDSQGRYPYLDENHSHPHETYGEFQWQRRHDNFGNAFGRY